MVGRDFGGEIRWNFVTVMQRKLLFWVGEFGMEWSHGIYESNVVYLEVCVILDREGWYNIASLSWIRIKNPTI